MIYGYARVSTQGQAKNGNSLEYQEKTLQRAGAIKIYIDTFTGTKRHRVELDKLFLNLKQGDTLIVTKLDRIARSTQQGIELINELFEKGITVNILNMGVMDNSPSGRLIRNIMLSFAEFERDMIVERTQEGKAIAKKNNSHFREGRPKVYTKYQLDHAIELLNNNSYTRVAELTGISKSTLIREKNKKCLL